MNTKEIISEINNGEKVSFRIPLKTAEDRKYILVIIFKARNNEYDIYQSYWMITNNIYKDGKSDMPGVDKIYGPELEEKIKYLNKIIKESEGAISIVRLNRPELEKIVNEYYNDI